MPSTTVRTLINTLATVVPDATADAYQDETYLEIARLAKPGIVVGTDAVFVSGVAGARTFAMPTTGAEPAGTLSYKYSSNTADTDPGSGFIKFDNASVPSNITAMRISKTDANAMFQPVVGLFASAPGPVSPDAHLVLTGQTSGNTLFFDVTGVGGGLTDNGTWWDYTPISVLNGDGTGGLFNGENVTITYTLFTSSPIREALMLFYDDTQLALVGYDEAHFYNPSWQSESQTGKPLAVVLDTFDKLALTPIPKPMNDGQLPNGADPVTDTFPWPAENWLVVGTTSDLTFASPMYADLELAVAFEVVAKELGRDSNHQDPAAAEIAKKMSDTFWAMSFPEMLEQEPEFRG